MIPPLSTTEGNRDRERIAEFIQQQLRQIGVEVTVRYFPSRVFFGEVLPRRTFGALAMYTWVLQPRAGCNNLYTSDGIPTGKNGWVGPNYPGYKSAEMDRICKAQTVEVEAERRAQLLRESARIFARDLPSLPLYCATAAVAAKVRLEHFGPRVPTTATWTAPT